MKKNDLFDIYIEDIGNDGEGIGHIKDNTADETNRGIAVFVKDAVVGDRVRVKLTKVKKTYAYGRLMEVIEPSPYRVEPLCPNARRCGGCAVMEMSYEKQREYKWDKVRNCLERIGGIADADRLMESVHGMETPYYYRNKMQFPVGLDKEGNIQIGFYAGRTHSIIDLKECYIGHPVNTTIVKHMRQWLQERQNGSGEYIYNENTGKGLVRHILTRVGFTTGELMVCVVINGDSLGGRDRKNVGIYNDSLVECLQRAVEEYNNSGKLGQAAERTDGNDEVTVGSEKLAVGSEKSAGESEKYAGGNGKSAGGSEKSAGESEKLAGGNDGLISGSDNINKNISLTSVSININKENTNRILGDKCITIYGQDYITDFIGENAFHISPLSFYQVNPVQTKVLYDKALEYAELKGNEIVWDMYCGIGTISLSLARSARKVYGVEIVPQAIEDAKNNARLNGIDNAEFYCGKAEEVVPAYMKGKLGADAISGKASDELSGRTPDVVVVDPPRKGCDQVLLDTIELMSPEKLVYVSCDPATLARDIKIMTDRGYELTKVAVVDQFCHSTHVESVALLSQRKADDYVEVELELDELDLTSAERR
ncbi:MAG: 23S rRNA (uracil(1939)-C(5))-methyltransferase RlmD [Wujia sp.]